MWLAQELPLVLESVDSGPEWAVIAAWVAAGAALLSIPVNLFISHKRLEQAREDSDKRMRQEAEMQKTRLAHERREAVRFDAVGLWAKGTDVLAKLHVPMVYAMATDGTGQKKAKAQEAVARASSASVVILALGWDEEVRKQAGALHNAVSDLWGRASPAVGAVGKASEKEAMNRVNEYADRLNDALSAYRKAIIKD